jgi:hypothetical protein
LIRATERSASGEREGERERARRENALALRTSAAVLLLDCCSRERELSERAI